MGLPYRAVGERWPARNAQRTDYELAMAGDRAGILAAIELPLLGERRVLMLRVRSMSIEREPRAHGRA
jgi:hypothetical protein